MNAKLDLEGLSGIPSSEDLFPEAETLLCSQSAHSVAEGQLYSLLQTQQSRASSDTTQEQFPSNARSFGIANSTLPPPEEWDLTFGIFDLLLPAFQFHESVDCRLTDGSEQDVVLRSVFPLVPIHGADDQFPCPWLQYGNDKNSPEPQGDKGVVTETTPTETGVGAFICIACGSHIIDDAP